MQRRGVGLREARIVRIIQVRIGRRVWRLRRLKGVRRLSRGSLESSGPLGVHERVEMKRLIRLLPDWEVADQVELTAVSPADRAAEPAVRSFVEFLAANIVPALAGAPGEVEKPSRAKLS